MRVEWTHDAERGHEEIAYHVRETDGSPQRARKLVERIRKACELRASQPESGARCPELGKDVRLFSVQGFVIIYRALNASFQVLMVSRGARNITAHYLR